MKDLNVLSYKLLEFLPSKKRKKGEKNKIKQVERYSTRLHEFYKLRKRVATET